MRDKHNDEAFQRALAHAQAEERKCAGYLKALGWRVLPTTNFSGNGAPMLEADERDESLVMPDLQAFRGGTGVWFEVKWKARATATDRFKGRLVTGVDRRNFEHYCRVEQETQIAVAIVFIHHAEREVRVATLYVLDQITSHETDRMGRGGMVFWHYDKIPRWMSLGELADGIDASRLGHVVAPTPPPIEPHTLRRPIEPHVFRRHGARAAAVPPPAATPRVVESEQAPVEAFALPEPHSIPSDYCQSCRESPKLCLKLETSRGCQQVCLECWNVLQQGIRP